MRLAPLGYIIFFSLLALCSCREDVTGKIVGRDGVERGDTATRTLLVYMMAENSLNNFASADVAEIVEAVPDMPDDCRLFVYVDDSGFPVLAEYFKMTDGSVGSSTFHPFENDICSSDTAALGTVLDFILKDYPTRNLDIVMWSHADGWLRTPLNVSAQRSIGIDNGKNTYSNKVTTSIEMEELATLLKRLPANVDRILFDACFMQCAEVAYALRDAAEWVIASPAEIPGDGADYSTLVPALFLSDGVEDVIDAYINAYRDEFAGAVLSAVDTGQMQHLADVTYSYVIKYFNTEKKRAYADVFSYLPGGKYSGSVSYPSYFDMNAVMKKYLTAEEYAHWREAYERAVVYVGSSPKWYSAICARTIAFDESVGGGISLYMPQHSSWSVKFNEDFKTTEWYSAAGWQAAGW